MIINFYDNTKVKVEYIFIMIFLPIIDFFRLFFVRIYKFGDPFKADENPAILSVF